MLTVLTRRLICLAGATAWLLRTTILLAQNRIPTTLAPASTPAHQIFDLSIFVVTITGGIFLVVGDELFEMPIDRRQLCEIGDRRTLVDGMHGLPNQAEFEHRAVILDEARIRRAAAGAEFGPAAGHRLGGIGDQIGQRPRRGQERLSRDANDKIPAPAPDRELAP